MGLYVISNTRQLRGKTIAFAEVKDDGFPNYIVTTDGGLMVWLMYIKEDASWGGEEVGVKVYSLASVPEWLSNSRFKQHQLVRLGVCTQEDIDEFIREIKDEKEQAAELLKRLAEEKDLAEYERLKAKYEGGNK